MGDGRTPLFTAASVVCGLAHDQLVLVTARLVQGIGGAISSSVIVAIIETEFTDCPEAWYLQRFGHSPVPVAMQRLHDGTCSMSASAGPLNGSSIPTRFAAVS